MPLMATANHGESREASPQWSVLAAILEAYAMVLKDDPEIANFIMTIALVVGKRLGLSDTVVFLVGESAAGKKRPHIGRSRARARQARK
jgi:hypothetical protein